MKRWKWSSEDALCSRSESRTPASRNMPETLALGSSSAVVCAGAGSPAVLIPPHATGSPQSAGFSGIIAKYSGVEKSCPFTNMRVLPAARSSRSWSVTPRRPRSARTARAATCARSCPLLPRSPDRLRAPTTCPVLAEVVATLMARVPAVSSRRVRRPLRCHRPLAARSSEKTGQRRLRAPACAWSLKPAGTFRPRTEEPEEQVTPS